MQSNEFVAAVRACEKARRPSLREPLSEAIQAATVDHSWDGNAFDNAVWLAAIVLRAMSLAMAHTSGGEAVRQGYAADLAAAGITARDTLTQVPGNYNYRLLVSYEFCQLLSDTLTLPPEQLVRVIAIVQAESFLVKRQLLEFGMNVHGNGLQQLIADHSLTAGQLQLGATVLSFSVLRPRHQISYILARPGHRLVANCWLSDVSGATMICMQSGFDTDPATALAMIAEATMHWLDNPELQARILLGGSQ